MTLINKERIEDFISDSTLIELTQKSSVFDLAAGSYRVTRPKGAAAAFSGSVTGAIKISLPILGSNNMQTWMVQVYENNNDKSFVVYISGNTTNSSTWGALRSNSN